MRITVSMSWLTANEDGSGADTDASPTIENNLFENNPHDLYLDLQLHSRAGTYLCPAICTHHAECDERHHH